MAKGNGKKSVEEQILDRLDRLASAVEQLHQAQLDANVRLDRIVENTGAHWRDLERRVAALERDRKAD